MRITNKGKRRVKAQLDEEETKEEVSLRPDSNIKQLNSMMKELTTGGNLKMFSGKEILKKFKI